MSPLETCCLSVDVELAKDFVILRDMMCIAGSVIEELMQEMPRQLGTEEPSATLWKVGVHCSDRLTNVPGILFDTKFCSRPQGTERPLAGSLGLWRVSGSCDAHCIWASGFRSPCGSLCRVVRAVDRTNGLCLKLDS
jgi:hypothetical protein